MKGTLVLALWRVCLWVTDALFAALCAGYAKRFIHYHSLNKEHLSIPMYTLIFNQFDNKSSKCGHGYNATGSHVLIREWAYFICHVTVRFALMGEAH
jgi:hypothetical protein